MPEALEQRLVLDGTSVVSETWATGFGSGSGYQLLADVNNDGRNDAIFIQSAGDSAGQWQVALSDGNAFGAAASWKSGFAADADWVAAADVTGDGRADAVAGYASGTRAGQVYVAASTGSGFDEPALWISDLGVGATSFTLADVDGDNKADAVAAYLTGDYSGQWYVARSSGVGFECPALWATGLGVDADAALVGDVTGDGKADAVAVSTAGDQAGEWIVAPSTGSAFGDSSRWYDGHGDGATTVLLADVGGDGSLDALAFYGSGDKAGQWYFATSTGKAFVVSALYRENLPGTALAADITGDGTDDPVAFSSADGTGKTQRSDVITASTTVITQGFVDNREQATLPPGGIIIPVSEDIGSSTEIAAAQRDAVIKAFEANGGGTLEQRADVTATGGFPGAVSTVFNLNVSNVSEPNLQLRDIQLVDAENNPVVQPVVGQQVFYRAVWSQEGFNEPQEYLVRYDVDGISVDSPVFTVVNGWWVWYRPLTFSSPGTHVVTITVDGAASVSEKIEIDNTLTTSFTPSEPSSLPQKFVFPVIGEPNRDYTVANYVDVDPRGGEASDFRGGPFRYDGHNGMDIEAATYSAQDAGIPIVAAAAGTVVEVVDGNFDRETTWNNPTPNYVVIDHGDGWVTKYYHLATSSITVQIGDAVRQGQVIGEMGSSGQSSRSHLHWSVYHGGAIVETMFAPNDYWVTAPVYQGDAPPTIMDSGVANYDLGSPVNEFSEGPSSTSVFPVDQDWPVFYWYSNASYSADAKVEVIWYQPDGGVYRVFDHEPNFQQPGRWYWGIGNGWKSALGQWQVALKVDGIEIDRQSFEVVETASIAAASVYHDGGVVKNRRITPIGFGSVASGLPAIVKTFTLTNRGSGELVPTLESLPDGFAVDGSFPVSVPAGYSASFAIKLNTEVVGGKFGEIRIRTNDPQNELYTFVVSGEVAGSPPAGSPVLTAGGPAVSAGFGWPAVLVDDSADVTDAGAFTWSGAQLQVAVVVNGTVHDRLSVQSDGTFPGAVSVVGAEISVGGRAVATLVGGDSGTPLVITFTGATSGDDARAVLRNVTYRNVSPTPDTQPRFLGLQYTDAAGNLSEQVVKRVVSVDSLTSLAPTAVSLSESTVMAGLPVGTFVGRFLTADPDYGDGFIYRLVDGDGDDDNASFTIDGVGLRTAAVFDAVAKGSYSIRVRATDNSGLSVEQRLQITVTAKTTIVASDTFDYNAGGISREQGVGWAAGQTWGAVAVDATLDYENVASTGDVALRATSGAGDLGAGFRKVDTSPGSLAAQAGIVNDKGFIGKDGTTLWISFLGQKTAGDSWFAAGIYRDTQELAAFLHNGWPDQDSYRLIGTQTSTAETDVALVVVRIDYQAGNDLVSAWLNPTITEGQDGLGTPDAQEMGAKEFNYFAVRRGDGATVFLVDELRMATRFEDAVAVIPINAPPTAITLENVVATVPEDADTTVRLKVADIIVADDGEGINTLSLTGVNAESFEIAGETLYLKAGITLDYETTPSLEVVVSAADATIPGSEPVVTTYSLTVVDANEAPSDISLTSTVLPENAADNQAVGILSAVDQDSGDSAFTYEFAEGAGDTDNAAFAISDTTLQARRAFDYEQKKDYSVRLRVIDGRGLAFEKAFAIGVTNVNEQPTGINLSEAAVTPETLGGNPVGELLAIDPDAGGSHTYEFVDGDGATDNTAFAILGADLVTLSTVNYSEKDSYSVRVRTVDQGGLGFEQSLTITTTIRAPAVTTHPQPANVSLGESATFTAKASGNPAPSIQWQVSIDGGTKWFLVPRATEETYTLRRAARSYDGRLYRAVFSSPAGTVYSDAALLTVTTPPQISEHPEDQSVSAGSTATFTAKASGNPAPSIRWQVSIDGGTKWFFVPRATEETYTLRRAARSYDGRLYRAVFSSPAGTVHSDAALLTVTTPPQISEHPRDQSVSAGSTATFTAQALGNPLPSVRWQKSHDGTTWVDIDNAQSTSYTTAPTDVTESGSRFRAVFTNSAGEQATTAAVLEVVALPEISSPNSLTMSVGLASGLQVETNVSSPVFSITAGTLPTNVTLDPETGYLSGTPGPGTTGTYPITIRVTNDQEVTASQEFVLTVNGSVSGFRVNQGLTQRSFIRYLELTLDSNESAQLLLANPQRVSLVKADLNGEGSEAIALDAKLSVVDDKVTVDFGVNGLGDNRLSNVGDGYYTFSVDLDGDGVGEVKFHFYRLLGDINGDREVTSADTQLVYAAIQARDAYDPNLDINGDGRINSSDLLLAQFAIGRKLKSTLVITS